MKTLTILGLSIDIIGAILIFLNSPKIEFEIYLYSIEESKELEKKATRMHRLTQFGALLLVIGFLFQIIAAARQ